MVAPYFGWSVGDVLLGIKVIAKVCQAFCANNGATVAFGETQKFLRILEMTLKRLERYSTDSPNGVYTDDIVCLLQVIEKPFKDFVDFVEGYEPALGECPTAPKGKRAWKRVTWSLQELDKLSAKTAELKNAVESPLQLVHMLLLLQTLENIKSEMATLASQQPDPNTTRAVIVNALENAAVTLAFQQQMEDLKDMLQRHQQEVKSEVNLIKTSLEDSKTPTDDCLTLPTINLGPQVSQNRDVKIIIAIETLRRELHRSMGVILDTLLTGPSNDDGAVQDEFELYRRSFRKLHESAKSSWITLDEVQDLLKNAGTEASVPESRGSTAQYEGSNSNTVQDLPLEQNSLLERFSPENSGLFRSFVSGVIGAVLGYLTGARRQDSSLTSSPASADEEHSAQPVVNDSSAIEEQPYKVGVIAGLMKAKTPPKSLSNKFALPEDRPGRGSSSPQEEPWSVRRGYRQTNWQEHHTSAPDKYSGSDGVGEGVSLIGTCTSAVALGISSTLLMSICPNIGFTSFDESRHSFLPGAVMWHCHVCVHWNRTSLAPEVCIECNHRRCLMCTNGY